MQVSSLNPVWWGLTQFWVLLDLYQGAGMVWTNQGHMQIFVWFGVEVREADCTKRKSSPWSLKLGGVQSLGSSFPWQWSWLKSTAEVWFYGEGWNHKVALKVELSECRGWNQHRVFVALSFSATAPEWGQWKLWQRRMEGWMPFKYPARCWTLRTHCTVFEGLHSCS